MRIAQHFSAGTGDRPKLFSVPEGRLKGHCPHRFKRPYGTQIVVVSTLPSDKSLGYSQASLRDGEIQVDLRSDKAEILRRTVTSDEP